ncbi:hypothetical protein MSG28_015213 [Choristoneura fumiferana]|uniref:Uncharacterized protein n=1 Tax=Choristoneura fumiferana TaxID=7141 RepID=A0ACC0KZX0_CHOFU|nr:hypothetical protein MSG28_015213 [Choristoneura fumiferana]
MSHAGQNVSHTVQNISHTGQNMSHTGQNVSQNNGYSQTLERKHEEKQYTVQSPTFSSFRPQEEPKQNYEGFTTRYETRLYDTPRQATEYSKTEEQRQYESNFYKKEYGYDAPKVTSPLSPKFNARDLKFDDKEPIYSTLKKPNLDGVGQTFSEHQKTTEAIPGGTKQSEFTIKSESYQSYPKTEYIKTETTKSPFLTSTPKFEKTDFSQEYKQMSTDLVKAATPDYERMSSPYGKEVHSYGGPNFMEETTTEVKEVPNGTQKITTTKIYSSSPVNLTTTNTKYEPVKLEGIDELSKAFDNDSRYSTLDSRFNTLESKMSSDTSRSFMRPSEFASEFTQQTMKKDLSKELDSMDRKFAKSTISSETIERKSVMTSSHKPWKGQQNEPNPAVVGMGGIPQNTVGGEPQGQPAPGMFNSRGAGKNNKADQTPTPTRFIRNCEEVGLFQDLLNPSSSDESGAVKEYETTTISKLTNEVTTISRIVGKQDILDKVTTTDDVSIVRHEDVNKEINETVSYTNNVFKIHSNVEIRKDADSSKIDKAPPIMSQKSLDHVVDSLEEHNEAKRKDCQLIKMLKRNYQNALKKPEIKKEPDINNAGDTDADPHNATRGFFYSHVGWLLVKKHPEVLKRSRTIDMSDIYNNPVLRFQKMPWKGQQNEPNPAVVGMGGIPQNTVGGEPQGQPAPGMFNSRGAGKNNKADQTPTPTRFIRNCEEVGLFQDLLNPSSSDESGAVKEYETTTISKLTNEVTTISRIVGKQDILDKVTTTDDVSIVRHEDVNKEINETVSYTNNVIKIHSNVEIRKDGSVNIETSKQMPRTLISYTDSVIKDAQVTKDVLLADSSKIDKAPPIMSQKSLDHVVDSLEEHNEAKEKDCQLIKMLKRNYQNALKKPEIKKEPDINNAGFDDFEIIIKKPDGRQYRMRPVEEEKRIQDETKERLKRVLSDKAEKKSQETLQRIPSIDTQILPNLLPLTTGTLVPGPVIENISQRCGGFLRQLSLRGCEGIADGSMKTLAQLLTHVNVSWCQSITENGVEALARGCPKLKSFICRGCKQVNDRAVSCLATYCPDLEVLNVQGCDSCRMLERMDLEECVLITDTLSHCELITDNGIKQLSMSPCAAEHLTVLGLDNCPLVTDGALEHLTSCHNLQLIELYDCQLFFSCPGLVWTKLRLTRASELIALSTGNEGKKDKNDNLRSTGERKDRAQDSDSIKPKSPSPDSDQYKSTTEPPVFIEDTNLNGYFSDASNNVVRRAGGPKKNIGIEN